MKIAKYVFAIVVVVALQGAVAQPSPNNNAKRFDNYVTGALDVYSQFQTPTIEESEKFYQFLKKRWTNTNCTDNCRFEGYKAGKEYSIQQNIKLTVDEKPTK